MILGAEKCLKTNSYWFKLTDIIKYNNGNPRKIKFLELTGIMAERCAMHARQMSENDKPLNNSSERVAEQ